MSSTGRGKKGGGGYEFHPTPRWPVHTLLRRLVVPGGEWLEAGAGDGAIIRAVNEVRSDVQWTAVELREECREPLVATGAEVEIEPFQTWAARALLAGRRWRVAMFNPPFSQADTFVRLLLGLCDHVLCLQRTQWIGDEEARHAFYSQHMPDDYRLGRCDFDGRGGDSTPYSWFSWAPNEHDRTSGRLELLPRASLGERKQLGSHTVAARQGSLFGS